MTLKEMFSVEYCDNVNIKIYDETENREVYNGEGRELFLIMRNNISMIPKAYRDVKLIDQYNGAILITI